MLGVSEDAVKSSRYRARANLAARADVERATGPSAVPPCDPVVERYVEAFNCRDADALAALFAEDALNEIVGSADEVGADVMRRNSLAEWLTEPRQRAVWRGVFGRNVLLVLEGNGDAEALVWMIEPHIQDGLVQRQRIYCFCPELLAAVGAEIGVCVRTRGYRHGA